LTLRFRIGYGNAIGEDARMNTQTHPIAISTMSKRILPRFLPVLLAAVPLLLAGCNQSADTEQSSTPKLLQVAERGDVSALDALLRRNRDANVRDSCQWTALMKAANNGHLEVAKRLLAAGATVDAADKGGYTALLLAAGNNHVDVVKLLLDNGAAIDAQEQTQGYSPLIWAAQRGNTDTVKLLLARGADTTLPDFQGHDAAWHAQELGHADVAALLAPAAPSAQPAAGS
jgi:ankyrin repeat protein